MEDLELDVLNKAKKLGGMHFIKTFKAGEGNYNYLKAAMILEHEEQKLYNELNEPPQNSVKFPDSTSPAL